MSWNGYTIKGVHHEFKRFVRKQGLPRSLYEDRCEKHRDDVCGGKGETCAPDDAPETFDKLLKQFCEEHGHDCEHIRPAAQEWIADLKQELPGPR
jgi:hypothetical protein